MPVAAQLRSVDPRLARVLYACFVVSGAAGLLYEVIWSSLLGSLVGGTTTTHTVVLAAFMGGLALGNRVGGRWADTGIVPLRLYAYLETAVGILGVLSPQLADLAGAIYVAAHKTLVSELSGLAKKMPYTMAAFTIGSLSMIGVPLFAGFVSKWNIALGAIEAQQLIFIGVLLLSTVLNASYFFPIVYKAYFETAPATKENEHIQEAPSAMVVPIMLTAAGTIVFGIYPDYFMTLITLTLG